MKISTNQILWGIAGLSLMGLWGCVGAVCPDGGLRVQATHLPQRGEGQDFTCAGRSSSTVPYREMCIGVPICTHLWLRLGMPRIDVCNYVVQTGLRNPQKPWERNLDMLELYSGSCRLAQCFRNPNYLASLRLHQIAASRSRPIAE